MLQKFTVQDRQNLVDLLDLSVDEIEEGSYLYRLLMQVEARDRRLGSDCYADINQDLAAAVTLRRQIRDEMLTGDQYIESRQEDGEYTVRYKSHGSALKGLEDRLKEYKKSLLRKIGWTNRADNNQLRAVWRSGDIQRQDTDQWLGWR